MKKKRKEKKSTYSNFEPVRISMNSRSAAAWGNDSGDAVVDGASKLSRQLSSNSKHIVLSRVETCKSDNRPSQICQAAAAAAPVETATHDWE